MGPPDEQRPSLGETAVDRENAYNEKAVGPDPSPEHDGYAHIPGPDLFTAPEDIARFQAEMARLSEGDTFIDWSTFWAKDRADADWLVEDVIARGRGHALYAPAGSKKSLFLLWLCARLATSRDAVAVVYFDYEMTEDDLYDRLEAMGYGADSDLSRLHYALLPDLPPLDTLPGADAVSEILDRVEDSHPDHHLLVVIDTTARAVEGPENDADTYRRFSTATGNPLKRRGVTWVRLDHTGKDLTKGQRGSAAKSDDPDLVWELRETQNGIKLTARKRRMRWAPEWVAFALRDDPLRFESIAGDWPEGMQEVVDLLDDLDVPVDVAASTKVAVDALKEAGTPRRRQVVSAAQRWRRERGTAPGTASSERLSERSPEQLDAFPETSTGIGAERHRERLGTVEVASTGTVSPPKGGTLPMAGADAVPATDEEWRPPEEPPPDPFEESMTNLARAEFDFEEVPA